MTLRHTYAGLMFAALAGCATPSPPRAAAAADPVHPANTRSTTMTDNRTFGRILGETARAAQRLHFQVLTDAGTDFESWVAFTLLTENAPAMPKDALVVDHAQRLEIDRSKSQQVLDRLASAGYVTTSIDDGTESIGLTPAGEAFLRRVRQAVSDATNELVGDLDPRDVDTTMGVLREVGDRASTRLR